MSPVTVFYMIVVILALAVPSVLYKLKVINDEQFFFSIVIFVFVCTVLETLTVSSISPFRSLL